MPGGTSTAWHPLAPGRAPRGTLRGGSTLPGTAPWADDSSSLQEVRDDAPGTWRTGWTWPRGGFHRTRDPKRPFHVQHVLGPCLKHAGNSSARRPPHMRPGPALAEPQPRGPRDTRRCDCDTSRGAARPGPALPCRSRAALGAQPRLTAGRSWGWSRRSPRWRRGSWARGGSELQRRRRGS